jgi:hypothetical protein
MTDDSHDARKAMDAANNPKLTDDQARTLVYEAIDNAEMFFGDDSGRELISIAVEKTITIFEHGFEALSNYAGQEAHYFGPNRQRSIEIQCLACGKMFSIPLILSGQQSIYGCSGRTTN